MSSEIINDTWIIIQILIGYNLVMPLILLFIYYIRKHASLTKTFSPEIVRDYAIIVTAYEQTEFLPSVVDSILKLKFENYLVYIVADKCDISNLHFADERIILLRPEETLGGNTRSHFYAIQHFKRNHDILTIIDSDNLVHPDYLSELNIFFDRGFMTVQGIRKAKNLNTSYACLDAARDIYYHFYDGKLLFGSGSSATLSGSGMAFTTQLYKDCLGSHPISGAGFDKVLQFEIVKRDLRIAFAEKAVVYDEKTSRSDQLVNQRSRWINTWFKYFTYGFNLVAKGIRNFRLNQLLFGIILLRPPLFIFLIMSVLCMSVNIFTNPANALIWALALLCFISAFIISLIRSETDKKIYQALINIPGFIFYQLISLSKIRTANKRSVATRHLYDPKT